MNGYILDTDTFSLLQDGHPQVSARFATAPLALVAVTIVTVDERLTGWYSQLRKARDPVKLTRAYSGLFDVIEVLKQFTVLPLTLTAAQRFYALRKTLPRLGKMDLVIAATVLEVNGILVTRNMRDFQQVPGLVLEDWSKP